MALFENYERRIDKINGVLAQYGISSVEECREICKAKGFDPYEIVKGIQPICFENACWAYTVGAAIAIKSGVKSAAEAAKMIGVGLQSFCIDGSVAEDRKVGLGHGNLGAMLLSDESKCFAFLAGHESFAAAEGAIGIVKNANKARKEPLRVILNGLGKDAAQIISRINGFTYVQTQFDYFTGKLNIVREFDEPFCVGHFPEEPVMPGVLIVEAMAQCGGILVLNQVEDPENYSTYFVKIDGIKFRHKVVPGDTLVFKLVKIAPIRRGIVTMRGYAFVGKTLVCEVGEFMAQVAKTKK